MKCSKCGKEFSRKVFPLHFRDCKGLEIIPEIPEVKEETEEELRQRAKAAGIKSWHNKKIENIRKELGE